MKRFRQFVTETDNQMPNNWQTGWAYPWVIGGGGMEVPYLQLGRWKLYVWNAVEKKHYTYDFGTDTFDLAEEKVEEDAPANAAGLGGVAGLGVGPKGEPGVELRRKKKKFGPDAEPLAEMIITRDLMTQWGVINLMGVVVGAFTTELAAEAAAGKWEETSTPPGPRMALTMQLRGGKQFLVISPDEMARRFTAQWGAD